jgi:nifR3 family TIM-barrel protein
MKHPFFIGSAKLLNKVLYAPLAGCSDKPFREMSRRHGGPGIVFCEMVKIDALVRNDPHTFRLLDYDVGMHPIGAQLCGSKPKMAAAAAHIVEDLGFDVIDFNCGCPVDKVTKDGSGSGMLKAPELIGETLSAIIAAVKVPVTVKIRAGWDEKSINAVEITRIAERAGAKAITIHGRTREQGYKGRANWDYIKACKAAAKEILVIGNGDVFDAESALRMFAHTGCDAVLVSRGTMGQPWIAQDILRALEGLPPVLRSVTDLRASLLEHFECIIRYQPERQSLLDMRRVGCWYLKRLNHVKELRNQLNRSANTSEVFQHLSQFSWEAIEMNEAPIFAESET